MGTSRRGGGSLPACPAASGPPALAASAVSEVGPDKPSSGTSEPSELPAREELLEAIESLYKDGLRPYGRILRKRVGELGGREEVDLAYLRALCESHSELLEVESVDGGEFVVLLSGRPANFVDIYGGEDAYPEELWEAAEAYFERLGGDVDALPGGRFASAEALAARRLPFLGGYTLGQVCHITQLALTKRKLLGYSGGIIVPYSQSTSMRKSHCAKLQRPCAAGDPAEVPASGLEMAGWDDARQRLREILQRSIERGASQVPLSNVKRLFRSQFSLELSETRLGHSKLTDLLQDPRFHDICEVHLQERGYAVLPVKGLAARPPPTELQRQTQQRKRARQQPRGDVRSTHAADARQRSPPKAAAPAPAATTVQASADDTGVVTSAVAEATGYEEVSDVLPLATPSPPGGEWRPSWGADSAPSPAENLWFCQALQTIREPDATATGAPLVRSFCADQPLFTELPAVSSAGLRGFCVDQPLCLDPEETVQSAMVAATPSPQQMAWESRWPMAAARAAEATAALLRTPSPSPQPHPAAASLGRLPGAGAAVPVQLPVIRISIADSL